MTNGMNDKPITLSLESYLNVIHYAEESRLILSELGQNNLRDLKCTSLHAVYLVQTLFSETSSDHANINRIALNLEAAAADLLVLGKRIRQLQENA
jgi:hypothetical protein